MVTFCMFKEALEDHDDLVGTGFLIMFSMCIDALAILTILSLFGIIK